MAQDLNRLARKLTGRWSAKIVPHTPLTHAGHEESCITFVTDGTPPNLIVPNHGQRRQEWRYMDPIYGVHASTVTSRH